MLIQTTNLKTICSEFIYTKKSTVNCQFSYYNIDVIICHYVSVYLEFRHLVRVQNVYNSSFTHLFSVLLCINYILPDNFNLFKIFIKLFLKQIELTSKSKIAQYSSNDYF